MANLPPKNPKKKKKVYVPPATRAANQALIRDLEQQERQGNWEPRSSQPPNVGVVEGSDHVASFKTGREGGPKTSDTLISDGDYSNDRKGFDDAHDHHGPWSSASRGHYSGPGS